MLRFWRITGTFAFTNGDTDAARQRLGDPVAHRQHHRHDDRHRPRHRQRPERGDDLADRDERSGVEVVRDPHPAFVAGTPAEIEQDTRDLLRLFEPRGGYIVSSGCEIPPEAREANVAAMVRTGLEWRPRDA